MRKHKCSFPSGLGSKRFGIGSEKLMTFYNELASVLTGDVSGLHFMVRKNNEERQERKKRFL